MAKGRINNNQADSEGKATVTVKEALSDLSGKADEDKVVVVSEKRAGKTVMGVEKAPVAFDSEGKATVTVKEAKYFLTVPGFELDGAKKTAAKEPEKADAEEGKE